MEEVKTHQRRVRYKGTHPKKFNEKYKEHNPEKYKETVDKVISKGSTPAGMHISIMVNEILDFFNIQENQNGLDVTLGYGGHTLEMLKKLNNTGHMYALDADPIEFEKTTKRISGFGYKNFTPINMNFANIMELKKYDVKFDFILADLGVSSMQIDDPSRGFSYKHDTTLDLRLDPTKGISAKERLEKISLYELEGMLVENADEPNALCISEAIVNEVKMNKTIETTKRLREVIEEALFNKYKTVEKETIKKTCQRVFQAIRIDINEEYEVLYELLENLPNLLNPGGKVAILTFHSGEDRLVKKAFKRQHKIGLYSQINDEITLPSKEECFKNPRAKSTKMRYAIK
ncbi:MAG: 16S rRNA (cytosine(1402)-N(4))-methyltransferase RsmH [bacterium]